MSKADRIADAKFFCGTLKELSEMVMSRNALMIHDDRQVKGIHVHIGSLSFNSWFFMSHEGLKNKKWREYLKKRKIEIKQAKV